MAWLWDSWEEYVEAIHPAAIKMGAFRVSRLNTQVESESHLFEALDKLKEAPDSLRELGFDDSKAPSHPDPSILKEAFNVVVEAIYAGEELLLYHKRLATSPASYGFLHQNDLLDHWHRYAGTHRIFRELLQLIEDIQALLNGYEEMARADERFIVEAIDLPLDLESEFRLSRNLFSVGFDEMGLLTAGRGFEGVLRKIADSRHILLEVKGKAAPASEADLYDLIEAVSRVRWKVQGTPLISRETKVLLHYLRTVRNGGAHASQQKQARHSVRETASVVANTATHMWKSVTGSRAHISPTTVKKDW